MISDRLRTYSLALENCKKGAFMDLKTFFLAALVALGFGGWPIIANYSKAKWEWIAIVIMTAGTLVVIPLTLLLGKISIHSVPSRKAIFLLVAAAVVNGIMVPIYSKRLADTTIPAGPLVVTVAVLMVVWAVILDGILNGVVPTSRQTIGFTFGAVAIYLLK